MKKVKRIFFSLFILFILAGVICDYVKFSYDITSKKVQTFDASGEVQTVVIYDFPIEQKIIGITSIFFYSLGFSIFISGFISTRIEERLNSQKEEELKKLRESISIDVFDSLFKTLIPKEVYKVIKQDIIENNIIRKDARWYLDFSEVDGNIVLKQTLKYTLHNLSHRKVVDPVQIQIGSQFDTKTELLSAKYISGSDEIICYPKSEDKPKVFDTSVEQEAYERKIEYKIEIAPHSEVEFTTVLSHTYYTPSVVDQYIRKYPIINGTLVVTHPIEYEFSLFSAMSTKFKSDIIEPDRKTFELKGAVLPLQSYIYMIRKTNNKPTEKEPKKER